MSTSLKEKHNDTIHPMYEFIFPPNPSIQVFVITPHS